jgi:hypothetical protein
VLERFQPGLAVCQAEAYVKKQTYSYNMLIRLLSMAPVSQRVATSESPHLEVHGRISTYPEWSQLSVAFAINRE